MAPTIRPRPLDLKGIGSSRQVVIVTTSSWTQVHGTIEAWELSASNTWHQVMRPSNANIGLRGWVTGSLRVQGDHKTPVGAYRIHKAFGHYSDPGSGIPYHHLTPGDYWAGDQRDPKTYNIIQYSRPKTAKWRTSQSEDLYATMPAYRYAACIDYNLPGGIHEQSDGQWVATHPADVHLGSAIFLHCYGTTGVNGYTLGCVEHQRGPDALAAALVRAVGPAADRDGPAISHRRLTLSLPVRHAPYDGARLLWFLGLHAVPGLETWDGSAYARVLRLPGGPGVVRLWLSRDGGYDAELVLAAAGGDDEAAARQQLAHLLDLDGDPGPAVALLSGDPLVGPLVTARPGLRAPGSVDHVETLLRTIVGQQISLPGARTVTGRVVAALGEPLPEGMLGLGPTHCFPTSAALAGADPEGLPMPRSRGRSVVAVAQAVLAGGEGVASGTPETAGALLALPGVGPWTAAYLALRAARDPRRVPADRPGGAPGPRAARPARRPGLGADGERGLGAVPERGPDAPVDRPAGEPGRLTRWLSVAPGCR